MHGITMNSIAYDIVGLRFLTCQYNISYKYKLVARCTTGPRRAYSRNQIDVDWRNAPLGLAELGKVDIVNQIQNVLRVGLDRR